MMSDRAINPRLCAEQMEGGVHMGLGYALSENFTSTRSRPDSLKMRDFGLVPARQMPDVDIILIEVPDEVGGYGAKGVGEIGCVATASAVASALHSYDGKRRFALPMDDAPAARAAFAKIPTVPDIILVPPTQQGPNGMRAFEFFAAKDASHAVALLAQHGPKVKVLAGGTDLLADLKFAAASHHPQVVVDISRADDLRGIQMTDQGLRIGSLVTHSEIMNSPIIREQLPALVDAAHTIGAVQTRNLGTLGGNLVTAVPSMDSGPTLVALDAIVTIAGTDGKRQMPIADFWVGPRKTVLQPHEILVDIIIPKENVGKPTHFLKFGLRKGQALALVNVAASFWVGDGNTFKAPRIGLGAVAPKVIHAARG
jgi:CO/xanthine dehydrogenase FAD-binding subunit